MRRVLLGYKSDWQPLLDRPDLLPGYHLAMEPLEQAELAQYDVIVPRSLADQALLRRQRDRGFRLPCLLPPAPAEQICDDKLMLNRMLQMAGFAALVPALLDRFPETVAQFPVVMKQRRDDWGQNCHVIRSPEEARAFRLDPARSFLQAHVPGEVEYATHMMVHRGRVIYDATIRYTMPSAFAVKGRRAEPRQRDWLAVTPERDLLCRILRCIGFSEGLCCLDYRIHDGQLYLFEINPRPGGSLGERLADFLPRYAGAVIGARV